MPLAGFDGGTEDDEPIVENDKVLVDKEVLNANEVFEDASYSRDTFHNNTVIDEKKSNYLVNKLKAYSAGSGIKVTWFHNIVPKGNRQSGLADISFFTDNVNVSYLKIINFQLKLDSELSFNYENTENTSQYSGSGLVFPGFTPNVGDGFLYEVEPGKVALFKVNNVPTRLSIKVGTSHQIEFTMVKLPTAVELENLESRVRDTAYFDTRRFLNETGALLKREEVIDLEFVRDTYNELMIQYIDEFYDKLSYRSIVRKDGIYDPYVVGFMKTVCNFMDYGLNVQDLLPKPPNYQFTLWAKLIDFDRVKWSRYAGVCNTFVQENTVVGKVNALINREYISLSRTEVENSVPYISPNIGGIDQSQFNDFEVFLALQLEYNIIDVAILRSLIEDIYTLDETEMFYRIPIILVSLKKLEHAILNGANITTKRPNTLPYHHITFEEGDDELDGNILTISSPGSTVVGVLDKDGNPLFLETVDVTYSPEGFVIDLTPLKSEYGITTFDGVITIIISNPNLIVR